MSNPLLRAIITRAGDFEARRQVAVATGDAVAARAAEEALAALWREFLTIEETVSAGVS